jgi:hypothetical protein
MNETLIQNSIHIQSSINSCSTWHKTKILKLVFQRFKIQYTQKLVCFVKGTVLTGITTIFWLNAVKEPLILFFLSRYGVFRKFCVCPEMGSRWKWKLNRFGWNLMSKAREYQLYIFKWKKDRDFFESRLFPLIHEHLFTHTCDVFYFFVVFDRCSVMVVQFPAILHCFDQYYY